MDIFESSSINMTVLLSTYFVIVCNNGLCLRLEFGSVLRMLVDMAINFERVFSWCIS